MEETLPSPKMPNIDLLNKLEKISALIPNRVLKVEGFVLKENHKEKLEIIKFVVPPKKEQRKISSFLDKKTKKIYQLIQKQEQRKKLLKEFHQSLIVNLFTGKIDLRSGVFH